MQIQSLSRHPLHGAARTDRIPTAFRLRTYNGYLRVPLAQRGKAPARRRPGAGQAPARPGQAPAAPARVILSRVAHSGGMWIQLCGPTPPKGALEPGCHTRPL